jgi:hypothetical protein
VNRIGEAVADLKPFPYEYNKCNEKCAEPIVIDVTAYRDTYRVSKKAQLILSVLPINASHRLPTFGNPFDCHYNFTNHFRRLMADLGEASTLNSRAFRIVAYLMGGLALVASFLVYTEYIHQLGFPDGFITELGYAERRLAYLFIGISLLFGVGFIYLGQIASRREIGKKLAAAFILYLIFILTIVLIDCYYRLHLMGSSGG